MSELIVREAGDDDGPTLKALAESVLADQPLSASESVDRPSLDHPAESFESRGGKLWVVMRGEEALGALGVYRRDRDDELELALIGLDRESRGQGLATALLAGADAFAKASGAARLGIWLDSRLDDAVGFLERNGFVREPGLKGRQDGSDAIEIRFARALGAEPELTPRPSEARPDGAS